MPSNDQLIDIDDAAIDESAVVDPDEDLGELANPSDDADRDSRREGDWRERDANRRTHGEDDLKA